MKAVLVALVACAALGFAIQRGGTCMVAAVEEFWTRCRLGLARSLVETALWVTLLVGLAALIGLCVPTTPRVTPGLSVVLGGVLLGIGACLNGACALGTLARIGSGQWSFFVTLAGIIAGIEAAAAVGMMSGPDQNVAMMPSVSTLIFASGFLLVALHWRSISGLIGSGKLDLRYTSRWATVVIGICITIIAMSVGSWSYTGALRAIFHDGPLSHTFDLAMMMAILAGAIAGGRLRRSAGQPEARSGLMNFARHLGGGLLMGLGGGLVPGGNDQLILFNAPMFEPFAWLALGTMTLTILACLSIGIRPGGSCAKSTKFAK